MFQNPLSQRIYALLQNPLTLSKHPDYQDLSTVKTRDGHQLGRIHVFQGERLEKMVISEFTTGPGIPASLIVIKPASGYDVPRFGSDFSLRDNQLHLDMDLFPHKDLACDINYFQRYYSPMESFYLSACQKYQSHPPTGLWLRNFISPYFFMAQANPDQQIELEDLTIHYLMNWLTIWKDQDQPSANVPPQQALRAKNFEHLALQNNPVKGLFNKLLGEEKTNRVLSSLY